MPVGFFRDEAFGLLTFVQASMLLAAFLSARLENSSNDSAEVICQDPAFKVATFQE